MRVARTVASPVGALTALVRAPNGTIYGNNGAAVIALDTGSWALTKVAAAGGQFLACDRRGVLYFARGAVLYRLRR